MKDKEYLQTELSESLRNTISAEIGNVLYEYEEQGLITKPYSLDITIDKTNEGYNVNTKVLEHKEKMSFEVTIGD